MLIILITWLQSVSHYVKFLFYRNRNFFYMAESTRQYVAPISQISCTIVRLRWK